MVASGGTVGAELGCGIVAANMVVGGWSLSWSRAKLAIALLAFHLGRRLKGTLGAWGVAILRAEFQSHLCEAERATL